MLVNKPQNRAKHSVVLNSEDNILEAPRVHLSFREDFMLYQGTIYMHIILPCLLKTQCMSM
jgi:hypothetical protein